MNNEKNKTLHELVKPGECWHTVKYWQHNGAVTALRGVCHCGDVVIEGQVNPDYFSPDQPHSQVVALVKAAVDEFGYDVVDAAIVSRSNCGEFDVPSDIVQTPAPEIAEAIYQLIKESK